MNNKNLFNYLHKSFYEYYIVHSIIEETLNCQFSALDEYETIIGTAFVIFDMDILSLITEHIVEIPVEMQYSLFFEIWYRSVLLTRRIKNE